MNWVPCSIQWSLLIIYFIYPSVQLLSCSVVSNSLWPHGLQHSRLPCPSPTSGASSNSSIESVMSFNHLILIPFSTYLHSFLASESFSVSQFFTLGGQIVGVSASASVLPMNIQDWFPLGSTGLISLQSKGVSRVFQQHSSKASVLQHSAFFMIHTWLLEKP